MLNDEELKQYIEKYLSERKLAIDEQNRETLFQCLLNFRREYELDLGFLEDLEKKAPEETKIIYNSLREQFNKAIQSSVNVNNRIDVEQLKRKLEEWRNYYNQHDSNIKRQLAAPSGIASAIAKGQTIPGSYWLTDIDINTILNKLPVNNPAVKIATARSISSGHEDLEAVLYEDLKAVLYKEVTTLIVPLNRGGSHWVLFIKHQDIFTYWDPSSKTDCSSEKTAINNVKTAITEVYGKQQPLHEVFEGKQTNGHSCGDLCLRKAYEVAGVENSLTKISGFDAPAMAELRREIICTISPMARLAPIKTQGLNKAAKVPTPEELIKGVETLTNTIFTTADQEQLKSDEIKRSLSGALQGLRGYLQDDIAKIQQTAAGFEKALFEDEYLNKTQVDESELYAKMQQDAEIAVFLAGILGRKRAALQRPPVSQQNMQKSCAVEAKEVEQDEEEQRSALVM